MAPVLNCTPVPLFAKAPTYIVSEGVDVEALIGIRPGAIIEVQTINTCICISPYREWWEPIEDEL